MSRRFSVTAAYWVQLEPRSRVAANPFANPPGASSTPWTWKDLETMVGCPTAGPGGSGHGCIPGNGAPYVWENTLPPTSFLQGPHTFTPTTLSAGDRTCF